MIYSRFLFSLKQRMFWSSVRKRRKEWPIKTATQQTVKCALTSSIEILLDKSDELSQHIYSGAFEWEEREWLKGILKPGDVFYDIGTNIGYFSLLTSEWCGINGKVISLEPVSKTFGRLEKNIADNPQIKNIQTFPLAASDVEEDREIFISLNGKDAWNSLAGNFDSIVNASKEKIKTIPIDILRKREHLPCPTVMKIDVEGWEMHVLKGAEETLRTCKPKLLIEFTSENLHAAGTSCAKLAEAVRSHGYELYSYNARYKRLDAVTDFSFEHKNLVAIPR